MRKLKLLQRSTSFCVRSFLWLRWTGKKSSTKANYRQPLAMETIALSSWKSSTSISSSSSVVKKLRTSSAGVHRMHYSVGMHLARGRVRRHNRTAARKRMCARGFELCNFYHVNVKKKMNRQQKRSEWTHLAVVGDFPKGNKKKLCDECIWVGREVFKLYTRGEKRGAHVKLHRALWKRFPVIRL